MVVLVRYPGGRGGGYEEDTPPPAREPPGEPPGKGVVPILTILLDILTRIPRFNTGYLHIAYLRTAFCETAILYEWLLIADTEPVLDRTARNGPAFRRGAAPQIPLIGLLHDAPPPLGILRGPEIALDIEPQMSGFSGIPIPEQFV